MIETTPHSPATPAELHQALCESFVGVGMPERPAPKRTSTVLRRLHDDAGERVADMLTELGLDGSSTPDPARATALIALLVDVSALGDDARDAVALDDAIASFRRLAGAVTESTEQAGRLIGAVVDELMPSALSWWRFQVELEVPGASERTEIVRSVWSELAARGVASVGEVLIEVSIEQAMILRHRPDLRGSLALVERIEGWLAQRDDRHEQLLKARFHWMIGAEGLAEFDRIAERLDRWALIAECDAAFGPTHQIGVELRLIAAEAAAEHDRPDEALALLRDTLWQCECDRGPTDDLTNRVRRATTVQLAMNDEVDEALVFARFAVANLEPRREMVPRPFVSAVEDAASLLRSAERFDECNVLARRWYPFACDYLGPRDDLTTGLEYLAECRD